MEKFAWFSSASLDNGTLAITAGEGYCTMKLEMGAYASVSQLRDELKPGVLGSATSLLILDDGKQQGLVLIERDATATIDPLKWQFPAGRMEYGELPVQTALREIDEEITLVQDWQKLEPSKAEIIPIGGNVSYTTGNQTHAFNADYSLCRNTVEFYFPMRLEVASLDNIIGIDNEGYNRRIRVFSEAEVNELCQTKQITESAAGIWKAWLQQRELIVDRSVEASNPAPAQWQPSLAALPGR
ncbi:NUDIX domain-containing protein [Geopseudomonas aromaticivorans]